MATYRSLSSCAESHLEWCRESRADLSNISLHGRCRRERITIHHPTHPEQGPPTPCGAASKSSRVLTPTSEQYATHDLYRRYPYQRHAVLHVLSAVYHLITPNNGNTLECTFILHHIRVLALANYMSRESVARAVHYLGSSSC